MATRYGYETLQWLKERGWQEAPLPADSVTEFYCGDQGVIDPKTNKELTVYAAAKLHRDRTGDYPEFLKSRI